MNESKGLVAASTAPAVLQPVRYCLAGPEEAPVPRIWIAVLTALHSAQALLSLEIRAWASGLEVALTCDHARAAEIPRAIRGAAPDWEIRAGEPVAAPGGCLRRIGRLARPGIPQWAPLRDAETFKEADPLAPLLEAVQPLAPDEQLLIRFLIQPARPAIQARLREEITEPVPPRDLVGLAFRLFERAPRVPRFEPRLQRSLEERLLAPAFELIGVVALAGDDASRLDSRARSLSAAFRGGFDGGGGDLQLVSWVTQADPSSLPATWQDGKEALYVTARELATLWHVPSNRIRLTGVSHVRRSSSPLPIAVESGQGLVLGTHHFRGQDAPVRLPRGDLEAGHLMGLGKTGVGKSTLFHQLLAQLLTEPDRPGLGVLDPHGALALAVAARSIPRAREREVVLLELGDEAYPVGLPFLWAPEGMDRELVVETTFSLIRLIFREHWSPTRMEDAVFALTATLCSLPEASLLDAARLFGDASFRRRSCALVEDRAALEFWQAYEQLSEAGKRELADPVLRRLRTFYRSRAVRNIVCQTSGVDFSALLERGGILLVSLAGTSIQASADLLGELIIAKLHLAAMARFGQPGAASRPFFLAVDESQRFSGASLPILLSEGRKLKLPLLLSTQFLAGWSEALAEATLGNVGTLIAFASGPSDSRRLAGHLRPFTSEDLQDLDRYEAFAKLQIGGRTMPAFDFRTLPVEAPWDEHALDRLRAQTRQRFAKPRHLVEEALQTIVSPATVSHLRIDIDED